ncbi:MAG: flagellar biosynthesis anti-sigma factor FlgM [Polyangiaceae bacterium]
MRINDAYRETSNATDAAARTPVAGPTAQVGGGGSAGAAAPPVTVTVSDKARELASQTSDVSDTKVAALQSSIANGSFKVNAQLIAQRIVDGD